MGGNTGHIDDYAFFAGQYIEHDKKSGLFSLPKKLGIMGALILYFLPSSNSINNQCVHRQKTCKEEYLQGIPILPAGIELKKTPGNIHRHIFLC